MSDRSIPPLDSLLEHRSWVRAVARRLLRDEHAAEDLAQEAWVRVMRSPPDPERDPKPWLRRVLKNLAINRHRGETRRAQRETAWRDAREERSPAELVAEAEQHKQLVSLVLDLEEPFKTALVLRFYEGLGPQEIAERLGIPVGTVHSRIARATERLKQRLDDEAGGDRKIWIAALLPLAGIERFVPAATATAATTSLAGVLLMTLSKPKAALLVVLLLSCFVGGGLWLASDSDGDATPTTLTDDGAPDGPELNTRGTPLTAQASSETAATTERQPATKIATVVRGRVVDARGEPVQGASVFVLPKDAPGLHTDEIRQARFGLVATGADGVFETTVGQVREPRLIAWHATYLAAWVLLSEVDAAEPLTLTLGDPRELRLRIEAPGGRWPVGLHVMASAQADASHARTWDAGRQYWSGDIRPWKKELEPEQVLHVATKMPLSVDVGEPKGWVAIPRHAQLPPDATKHTIRLVRSAKLTVHLIDAATGQAPGAEERLALVFERTEDETLVASLGRPVREGVVEVATGLAPGTHMLYVNVTGYEPYRAAVVLEQIGAQVEHTARLEVRSGANASGRVVLRIADGAQASAAVRKLADARAPVSVALSYQVLVRKHGEQAWDTVIEKQRADGTLSLRSDHTQAATPGMPGGVYDIFVAKRNTGTAAFLKGVRIYADQDNEIDVRLEPGTLIRMRDLVDLDEQYEDLRFVSTATGVLPVITWSRDGGTWSITDQEGMGYLLRVPVEPHVLGPFPVREVEVTITPKGGKAVVKRVRGASQIQR